MFRLDFYQSSTPRVRIGTASAAQSEISPAFVPDGSKVQETDCGVGLVRNLLAFVGRLPRYKLMTGIRSFSVWIDRYPFFCRDTRTMKNNDQEQKPESIAFHLAALIGGLVMMVLGVGLSVTMVLLPLGIPLGLAGLGVFILGLTPGWRR
jgi:hypothetical protein